MVLLKSFYVSTLSFASVLAATYQQVTNFGPNPTNTQMWMYKPDVLASPPPVLVGIHWCSGSALAFSSGTNYKALADQYGFIVIYPSAPDSGGCWDVHTTATLTHDAGGDSLGIASMVRYVISTYGADKNRVFATGISSGAMMTNVLLGAYPDLFKGGFALSGVPYGCFAGPDMWNSACSQGTISKTPAEWGNLVRSGYPGFTGTRPKMQVWHGTLDDVLFYQNFLEEIKQWTNVLGVSQTPTSTETNTPLAGYTKTTYGPNFIAVSAGGVGHNIPGSREADVLGFFGLNVPLPTASLTSSTTRSTTSTTSTRLTTSTTSTSSTRTTSSVTPTTSSGTTVPHWGQCGGQGYTGPTVCATPYTCVVSNAWYSQCL